MFLLNVHVPHTHLEQVKEAIFAAGAGIVGQYSHCCWQTAGEGQFMPLSGSHAFIGTVNQLEKVEEYKIETLCHEKCIHEVIAALKKAHPYETPSYQVMRVEDF